MDENLSHFDPPGDGDPGRRGQRPRLQLNLQTVATAVLIVALVAILWLFFGPQPEPAPDLGQLSPTASALAPDLDPSPGTTATVDETTTAVGAVSPTETGGGPSTPSGTAGAVEGSGSPTSGAPAPSAPAVGALTIGSFAAIGNTDGYGIRLRFGPGADYATIRIIPDGEVVEVVSGPESAENLAWWRVKDNQGNIGWTAQDYLVTTTAPANWAPPAASPTFAPGG